MDIRPKNELVIQTAPPCYTGSSTDPFQRPPGTNFAPRHDSERRHSAPRTLNGVHLCHIGREVEEVEVFTEELHDAL